MNSNDAEIQAGEWLARLDRDAPSATDSAEFDHWKAADSRHAAAYARLAATWQALDRIRAIRPSADASIDNDYLHAAIQRHPPDSPEPPDLPHPSPALVDQDSLEFNQLSVRDTPAPHVQDSPRPVAGQRRAWFFLAAAAALLAIATGFWISPIAGRAKIYTTGIGGFQRVILEDQSTVELNTDSEIRVALTPHLRKVDLVRGEANFEVAHDSSRPFVVSAGNLAVRAVGTKFDVRRLDNSVEVTVDEGRVAVGPPALLESKGDLATGSISQLTAGQSALATGSGVSLRELPKREIVRKFAWQNQMLVFDGDTLTEVIAQFNRYNSRQLVIADPSLASLQIGGYFRPTNLDAFINVLQSDFGVRVSPDGNRLLLAASIAK